MLILTGEKGSGKTTLIRKVLSESEITAQGFLSVKEMNQGLVTGISLLILPEKEFMPMAASTPMETDTFTKRFFFYPGVFERVNDHFRTIRPGLPFILDEFGPLEMQRRGHYPIFRTLLDSSQPALIVVRSELVGGLTSFLGSTSRYRVIHMGDGDPAATGSRIAAYLLNMPYSG